ncbi:predicted protein [Postia placenta Mad-698-R]|uniref:Uncharacterized protein n=1 Tax=Postia placenta MAD-698-R-SB12 TaxID=670580 RepID=A0A1X6N0U6_9APHY|nr:hypothetical protein POSPLADRAFT_1143243 [Postia placenta MAD-698-R-SB12]EED82224.1 predicted protein [Postia placenta Mad-698-R]OSX62248.1 hypothetical protein POSPLADRAFT_1143243 [Postia placenta MAD-698-R-SB12]
MPSTKCARTPLYAHFYSHIQLEDPSNDNLSEEQPGSSTNDQKKEWYPYKSKLVLNTDWGNPLTRPHIHVYPKRSDGIVSEVWHGKKWNSEMDLDALSPMWDAGQGRHFYVQELARLSSREYVIPVRWFTKCGVVHADAFKVEITESCSLIYLIYVQKDWFLTYGMSMLPQRDILKACPIQFETWDFKKVLESTHNNPIKVMDASTKQVAQIRLFGNSKPLDNPMQSCQFKTVIQTAVFHVYDLVGPFEFRIWKSVGDLAVLVWFPEIFNLTEYIGDLKIAVGNVLDVFSEQDPSKITKKIKLHLLNHTDEDIKRFGPLIRKVSNSMSLVVGGTTIISAGFKQDLEVIVIGQVNEILMQAGEQEPLVVLDVFEISKKQHEIFTMPFVECRQGEMLLLIVKASGHQPSPLGHYIRGQKASTCGFWVDDILIPANKRNEATQRHGQAAPHVAAMRVGRSGCHPSTNWRCRHLSGARDTWLVLLATPPIGAQLATIWTQNMEPIPTPHLYRVTARSDPDGGDVWPPHLPQTIIAFIALAGIMVMDLRSSRWLRGVWLIAGGQRYSVFTQHNYFACPVHFFVNTPVDNLENLENPADPDCDGPESASSRGSQPIYSILKSRVVQAVGDSAAGPGPLKGTNVYIVYLIAVDHGHHYRDLK